ncbi:MAG: PEGA domain-containing protein [Gemmatimonadota bacterium]
MVSVPSGKIVIDDSIVGATPKSLSIPAGTHKIRISRERYLPYETTIVILSGEYLRITDIVLKEKPKPCS